MITNLNNINKLNFAKILLFLLGTFIAQVLSAKILCSNLEMTAGSENIADETTIYFTENNSGMITDYSENNADNSLQDMGNIRIAKPFLVLKTNLLYDVASVINLEVEVPISKRWSVLGEYVFPWWLAEKKQLCLQIINANLEGRYWFGPRLSIYYPQLTGWFAGVYGGGGYYDVKLSDKGYQGEFYASAGLTGGFAHTLGGRNNLRMEYSLGAGYFKTKYSEYNSIFGSDDKWHLITKKDGNYSWIGPTRLKVSLVWLINHHAHTVKRATYP